jgi:hypothetical protein
MRVLTASPVPLSAPFPNDVTNVDVPQENYPGCYREVSVHICIPDSTSAVPSWADPPHCVSNVCEPFPDLVITWQRQTEIFADGYDVSAVGGEGLRMQHERVTTWPDSRHDILIIPAGSWPFSSYEAVRQVVEYTKGNPPAFIKYPVGFHTSLSLRQMRFQSLGASYFVCFSKVRLREPFDSSCVSSEVQYHVMGGRKI